MAAADPAPEAERLYGLPPDEFTAARDELAKRLRSDGRVEEAAAVKTLKKPNLPAWALNQLARRHRAEVKKLLEAGARLREAHEQLLSGGKQDALRKAVERERELVASLVQRAEPLLSEAGKPSPGNLERVRSTLHAAATHDEVRAELEAGRLVRDRESVGLGPFVATSPAAATKKAQQRADTKRRELREARAIADRAAKQLQAAEAALERAKEDAEWANRQLRDRQRSLEVARRAAEEAREALEAAERD